MYNEGDIIVLLRHNTIAIGIVEEVDTEYLFLDDIWVHSEANTSNFSRVYQLNDYNKNMIKHLDNKDVIENGRELFKILFEGKKV